MPCDRFSRGLVESVVAWRSETESYRGALAMCQLTLPRCLSRFLAFEEARCLQALSLR
jgi:hypothetical protein